MQGTSEFSRIMIPGPVTAPPLPRSGVMSCPIISLSGSPQAGFRVGFHYPEQNHPGEGLGRLRTNVISGGRVVRIDVCAGVVAALKTPRPGSKPYPRYGIILHKIKRMRHFGRNALMTLEGKTARGSAMMKVMRRLFSRILPLLLAGAFMAFPASAAPVCEPHEHHVCEHLHLELHEYQDAGSHDPASHEHSFHVHGNCHVPMTRPDAYELSIPIITDSASWLINDLQARSGTSVTLERPPRA